MFLLCFLAKLLAFFAPLLLSVTAILAATRWGFEPQAFEQQVNDQVANVADLLFTYHAAELVVPAGRPPIQEADHG